MVEMRRIYYVDVANSPNSKKRKNKVHVVYDGEQCFRIKSLTELKDAEEIYLDAIFPSIYNEVHELLKSGVKVYLLKDSKTVKEMRERSKLKKSDENDATILSLIPRNKFRKLTEWWLSLEVAVIEYKRITSLIKLLKQWLSTGGFNQDINKDVERLITKLRRAKWKATKEIIQIIKKNPTYGELYQRILEELGLKRSAILPLLITKLPLHLSIQKLKVYLGFTPNTKRRRHRLRELLSALAVSVYKNKKKCGERSINKYDCKKKMLYKLQLRILKIIKKAYRELQQKQMTGGPASL